MMMGLERPLALLLLLLVLFPLYNSFRREETFKQLVSLSRALLILLLVLAVAGPTITLDRPLQPEPQLTVLADESTSTSILEGTELELEGVEVREKVIASGNSSELKRGILRHLEPDTNYLAVSDFQSSGSLDGVADRFREVNSTLNVLEPREEEESAVRIEGPETAVPGAENRFTVHVSSTGEPPEPQVTLDGEYAEVERVEEGEWSFTHRFVSEGSHRLKAEIGSDDRYDMNDRYFMTIEVTEKPEVLVVGSVGGMAESLRQFYDVSYSSEVPEDVEDYYAVIAKNDVEGLERYAIEGNGVVYTGKVGGRGMDILPVRPAPEDESSEGTKIVLAVDISISTGEEGKVKMSKKIAYNLVDLLPFNNRVGAVAYNRDAFLVSEPEPLSLNRERLKNKIARLEPSGPSLHNRGLEGAEEALNGTGNIIWITDGRIGGLGSNRDVREKTLEFAGSTDTRLITVSVGDDSNTGFLQDVADESGGMYMDSSDSGRLKFVFAAGGAEDKASRLVIVDPLHFVTQGKELEASSTGFEPVEPRRGADLLVTGTGGQPFLTTWRYGLGRVAAFTGGDTELNRLRQKDSSLLMRTVSWAVGDPQRKEDRWVEVGDGTLGDEIEVRASYPVEGLRRQSDGLHIGETEPESQGFHTFSGKTFGYNYPEELSRIGYRDVQRMARRTGGEVFSPVEEEAIRENAVNFSSRTVPSKTSVSKYLLFIALLLFLVEVGYRKWNGRM